MDGADPLLTNVDRLDRGEAEVAVVTWQGQEALRLNGLVLLPDVELADGHLAVRIGADGPCYAGLAFRAADRGNHELVYAQPHTSGGWDALQYDPVHRGSNTWQLHHGPGWQQTATVPTGRWFDLRVDFADDLAQVSLDDQPPLVVRPLAHQHRTGRLGLWSYLPAHFRDLRYSPSPSLPEPLPAATPAAPPAGLLTRWHLDGVGPVTCEPHGVLKVNRYLPLAAGPARLTTTFEVPASGPVTIDCGFSDTLTLSVDEAVVYTGRHVWGGMTSWAERGYVAPTTTLAVPLTAGTHRLTAELGVSEPFGWGLLLAVRA